MVIITGTITATEATLGELLRISLEHVRRSRREPGCLSHNVAVDAEDPLRLIFIERWVDMDAVRSHFAENASNDFVRAAMSLSELPPTLELFEATATAA